MLCERAGEDLGAWYMVSRISFMAWHVGFHIELSCSCWTIKCEMLSEHCMCT